MDSDSRKKWLGLTCLINGLMVFLVATGDTFAQSYPTFPLDERPELSFNLTDDKLPIDSTLSGSTPSAATASVPIHWNLTDQPTDDQCQREVNLARAGHPFSISRRASTTYNEKYEGYFVGGGVPTGRSRHKVRGEPRYHDEGIWGMDYAPFYSRVASNWSHGRLFQGGIGQYEPDHKNRPFGQTFGKHFGNRDRRFETEYQTGDVQAEPTVPTPIPIP